jgi:Rieske Fe-S protein
MNNPCNDCPLLDRRGFLELAMVAFVGALWSRDEEHAYPIPAGDGATIDKDTQVILVRFEQKAYAFNLSCPHQRTALHWLQDEGRFQCPKHKSRYQPDGVFVSGRATRNMDRFAVRRDGATILVDMDKVFKSDVDAAGWAAAVVAL